MPSSESKTKVLACATVMEEMLPLLPDDVEYEVLDFGLHLTPDKLRNSLQEAIDRSARHCSRIVLGYGLCSLAVVGLRAKTCTLIVPRIDDCISIFLGSSRAYKLQAAREPGTYYLTKGWIEVGDTPFEEYNALAERYGPARAERMIRLVLRNYTRLAYIDTGVKDQDRYREYTRRIAERFGLRYEEIKGSKELVEKMVYGPYDEDFVVAPPGHQISYLDFRNGAGEACNPIPNRPDAPVQPPKDRR